MAFFKKAKPPLLQKEPHGLEAYLDVEERDSRQVSKRAFARLSRYLLKEKKLLALGIVLILLGTAATLTEPYLFGYAIDEAIVPKNFEKLRLLSAIFLGVVATRVGAVISHAYVFELIGQRVMQGLRLTLLAHLQVLPVAVYDKNPAGRLVTRVTNDIAALAEMFSAGFVMMIGNGLVVVGVWVWLFFLHWKLALIALSVMPVLVGTSMYFSGKLRVAYRNARSKLSALNAFLAENILGMRVVNLFNRQKLHLTRFAHVNQWYADAQIGSVRVFAYFQPTITWSAGIAMALLVWYGAGMVLQGEMKLGVLVAFFSYVLSVFQPMREIADKWNIFLSGMASAERIFSILDWKPELDPRATRVPAVPVQGLRGHIVFENVWFAYEGEHWVLKNFSLEILPGQRVGVVGHTGAGKTTLIALIMRFYEPQKGRILLDGRDLREYDRRELRAAIGIVQQDVFLFSGSIRENVTLWRELGAQAETDVSEALEHLGVRHWLDGALELQERGSNLSMGQRQVLAFTRALAARPSIWILDEATANIDSETEHRLDRALNAASAGRTAILIAHRLATVRSSDLILVLHKGALVEKGRHDELLANDGLYARLYRYQAAMDLG